MKHEYKKPTIEIRNWFVSSDHIRRLHEFFQKRFPESKIEISLETESGHTRIYETLNEYFEDIPKLLADSEIVSRIDVSEREGGEMYTYKQAWIDIVFGKYNSATIHVIGGDTDESNKDWVEGTYTEALKLKGIFEPKDISLMGRFNQLGNGIVFDPDGAKFEAVKKPDNKTEQTQKVEVVNSKISWHQTWWGVIILGVVIATIIYFLNLN